MTETVPEFFVDLTNGREFVVNRIVDFSYLGSHFAVTLGSVRIGTSAEGKLQPQATIIGRFRFDLEMAKILHDALGKHIGMLTAPPDVKAN